MKGHEAVVGFLVDRGASIELEDNDGWTALNYAAKNGHFGAVAILLERGVEIGPKTLPSRLDALLQACERVSLRSLS